MRFIIALVLTASCCFGQGKQNVIQSGNLVPPQATFASAPSSPATGAEWTFTDASASGVCTGGGTAIAKCRWSGSAWQAVGGSGGGGGSSISLSTFAARPSCTSAGAVVMFTDSYYNSAFCDGATYHYLFDGVEMFPPDLAATFVSVNLSTATFDSTHGPGVIVNTTDQAHNIKMRATAKPITATWHVILALRIQSAQGGGSSGAFQGIMLRNSASQAIRFFGAASFSPLGMYGLQFSNPTTYSSSFFVGTGGSTPNMQFYGAHAAWIRVGEDGVNRTWDVSLDQGATWINEVTEAVGTGLIPDQVGYFVDGNAASIIALSWQTAP